MQAFDWLRRSSRRISGALEQNRTNWLWRQFGVSVLRDLGLGMSPDKYTNSQYPVTTVYTFISETTELLTFRSRDTSKTILGS